MNSYLRDSGELDIRLSELEYRNRINKVITFIWNNPDGHHRLTTLASVAGFSSFHFHRIFVAFVGETLGEYVRRIKLVNAGHHLVNTKKSVTEIAMETGYDTPSAFSKAFKKLFGVNPTRVRSTGQPPALVNTQEITNKRRRKMNPEIRLLPKITVYYATARGSINQDFTAAADKAFTKLCAYVEKNQLEPHIRMCLGISPDDPDVIPAEQQRYEAGFVFKDGIVPPTDSDIKVKEIPAGRVAVFMHQGPYSTLWQVWNAIYREWLPSSEMQLRDVAPFEVYLDDKSKTKEEKLRTEIYIPIK